MDPLRPVRPGERAGRLLRADTFNALLDAAALARGLRGGERGSSPAELPDVQPHATIWVRAHTALPIGAVVRIAGPAAWQPHIDPVTASRRPAFDTANPAEGEPFVILQEPAAEAGVLARAAVAGAALVRLRVLDELHGFADVLAGDPSALKPVPHGPARVLWVEESPSTERWAVVRLGEGAGGEAVEYGCGLAAEEGTVAIDHESLAGSGLRVEESGDPEECPTLGVYPGCHVAIGLDGRVGVDAESLAGTGLVAEEPESEYDPDCPRLAVDTEVDSTFTLDRLEVAALSVAPDDEPTLVVTESKRQFHFDRNAAGLVVNVRQAAVAGAAYTMVSFWDTNTVGWVANTDDQIIGADVFYQKSITADPNGLALVGDQHTPGALKYYGTNAGGEKGWHPLSPPYPPPPPPLGCGLDYDPLGRLRVNLTDIALEGLVWDAEHCSLTPVLGCGLTLVAVGGVDRIAVDIEELAGDRAVTALVVQPVEECAALAVDRDVVSTTTETLVTDVSLALAGGNLVLSRTKVTFTNSYNAAGLLVSRTAAAPVTTTQAINPCLFAACCEAAALSVAAGAMPASGTAPLSVSFSATPAGGVAPFSFAWNFGDGLTSTAQNPMHEYLFAGEYTAGVTVTDACGRTATDSVPVAVSGAAAGGCFAASTPLPAAIPDNNPAGVSFPVPVSGLAAATALTSVHLTIAHTWVGNLVVRLIDPHGTSVTLINRINGGTGNSNDDGFNITLQDGGGPPIQTAGPNTNAIISGTFGPANPLSTFTGDPNGTWTLVVEDWAPDNVGTVEAVTLCFGGAIP